MAQKVFLTGASGGLGRALADHYASRGAILGLVARRAGALRELAARLPGRALVYPVDVCDAAAMQRAGRDFLDRVGAADLVIANAGVSVGTLTGQPEDLAAFARVMHTNVLGLVHSFHPFVAAMCEARRGTLAGITSVAGIRGLAGAGAYCASKSAAITYLESLRLELRSAGVRVVTVVPGYIATPMTAGNPYPMPFLLSAGEAARRIARVIARGDRYAVVPWQMAIVAKLLRMLPDAIFDPLFERAGRKPRGLPP